MRRMMMMMMGFGWLVLLSMTYIFAHKQASVTVLMRTNSLRCLHEVYICVCVCVWCSVIARAHFDNLSAHCVDAIVRLRKSTHTLSPLSLSVFHLVFGGFGVDKNRAMRRRFPRIWHHKCAAKSIYTKHNVSSASYVELDWCTRVTKQ